MPPGIPSALEVRYTVHVLTLTFLGIGSAFAKLNDQSNVLLESWRNSPELDQRPQDNLLIDFGTTGPRALWILKDKPGFEYLGAKARIHYPAIRRILITHTHADHVGGLQELAHSLVATQDGPNASRPLLISTRELMTRLWNQCLSGGLDVLHGRSAQLSDYFIVQPVTPSETCAAFTLSEHYEVFLYPTDHIRPPPGVTWPSYGCRFRDRRSGETISYTGDTRFDPGRVDAWQADRMVFHEVDLTDKAASVHTPLSALRSLPESLRLKIVLYHLDDCCQEPELASVSAEFAGFAVPHSRYVLFP